MMTSFYEHLSYMTAVFDSWTPCERTVVLCALIRRVPWYNYKLLKSGLEVTMEKQMSPETEIIETEANDVEIVREAARITDDNDQLLDMGEKLAKLLIYLPLLEPTNERAKEVYLNSVPDIIQICVDNNYFMHECKQYLSYMLIHPALDSDDRHSLSHWLRYLENHLAALEDNFNQRSSSSPSNYGSAGNLSNETNGSNDNLSNGTNGSTGNLSEGSNGSNGNLNNNGNQAQAEDQYQGAAENQAVAVEQAVTTNQVVPNQAVTTNQVVPNQAVTTNQVVPQQAVAANQAVSTNQVPPNVAAALPPTSANGAFRRTVGKNIEPKNDGGSPPECLLESFSKNGTDLDFSNEDDNLEPLAKSQRSNSLTPSVSTNISSSSENLSDEYFVQKPRSFSLSSEHMAQLKPLLATTGSETRLDVLKANRFEEHPGMTTVAQWLKSLRLHKYVWLFSNISYEQMMAMDEEYLLKLGVTTGARHKLLLCINKLHIRSALLEGMSQELSEGTPNPTAIAVMLETLREVLISPLLPGSRLCDQLVQVLELASTCLLLGAKSNPPLPAFPAYNHHAEDQNYEHPVAGYDPLSMHCWLLDRALHHPSFICNPEHIDILKKLRYRLPPRQFFSHLSDLPFTKRSAKPRWRSQGPSSKSASNKRPSNTWLTIPSKHRQTNKSSSYPSFPTHKSADSSPRLTQHSISLNDINSRLESLCLQMTEKAMTE